MRAPLLIAAGLAVSLTLVGGPASAQSYDGYGYEYGNSGYHGGYDPEDGRYYRPRYRSNAVPSWHVAGRPSACTTRHHGTASPCSAITRPTWRGPAVPTRRAIAPYVVTRPGGTCSTSASTAST